VVPLPNLADYGSAPFEFSIAMGVRKGDVALRDTLDRFLARRRRKTADLLKAYGVPLAEESGVDAGASGQADYS
jgi:hypothetical protein